MSEDLKVFGKTYTGVTGIQAKDVDGLNKLIEFDWYDINSGDLTALFDQYAEENNMLVMELTFASNQETNTVVQHNLGRVPEEIIFYSKSPYLSGSGYQAGYMVDGYTGQDNSRNRTIKIDAANYSNISYLTRKDLISFISSVYRTDYFLIPSAPTSTEITIRGGTNNYNRLLAGEYKLALR